MIARMIVVAVPVSSTKEKLFDFLDKINRDIPEFCLSHWLLRVPLAVVFIQQGLSKLPLTQSDAESYGLPLLVWFFVAWGEILSGVGLLLGGVLRSPRLVPVIGDIVTRFCGIVICGIMTGVILMSEPEGFIDVLLYDNLHVMLYFGGLFFALRGNRAS